MNVPDQALLDRIKSMAHADPAVAGQAMKEHTVALNLPLREGVLKGAIATDIFEEMYFAPGTSVEFPIDFIAPGTEKDYVAYTIPQYGALPSKQVEGDYVMAPTYEIGASIDYAMKYARDARWDIDARAIEVLKAMFTRKMNDDAFRVLLAAAYGRGLTIYDSTATAGLFTKRLLSNMRTVMGRNGGGNSTSLNKSKLTDVYMSIEALEDIRSWDLTMIDDVTRREIYVSTNGDGDVTETRIFGVKLHDLYEFGVSQEYQNYFTSVLGGSLPGSKEELVLGLDLSKKDSFIMPWRRAIEIYPDYTLHRQRRVGYWGDTELSYAVLDSRRVLAGAL